MNSIRPSLESIRPLNSGLNDFDPIKFELELKNLQDRKQTKDYDPNFYKIYGLFLREEFSRIEELILADPSIISCIESKSLKVLALSFLGREINAQELFPLANKTGLISQQKNSRNLAKNICSIVDSAYTYSSRYRENFAQYQLRICDLAKLVPELLWYYPSFVLERNISSEYQVAFGLINQISAAEGIEPGDNFASIWRSYLLSLYYRKISDKDNAELELQRYRDLLDPSYLDTVKIKSLANQDFYPPDTTLENWNKILDEVDSIQRIVESSAGLDNSTCEYFDCADCCSNTFPTMSLTEYRYLLSWLEANHYDTAEISARAESIQKDHEELFGSRLEIVDKSLAEHSMRGSENPHGFKFCCPFLQDGKCSVHPARPLICRGFGLSTENNISVKTCNFYQAQYRANTSPENIRYVFDLRMAQMLARSSDKYLDQGRELKGTIVAWFSQPS